jgi:hypothetical protein
LLTPPAVTKSASGCRPTTKNNKYDVSVKEMLVHNFLALLRWLVPEVVTARVLKLPTELPATARQVDLLVRVRFKAPGPGQKRTPDKILIVEFQAQRDPQLHRRMLLRTALAHALYGQKVETTLLALTAAAVVPQAYVYGQGPEQEALVHRVTVRRLFDEPAEAALATEIKELLPLIPAMKPEDGNAAALLRRVVERILSWALPDEERDALLEQAAQFARLRLPRRQVDGTVRDVTRRHRIMLDPLRDFPMVRDGYRKGKAEGFAKGVIKGEAKGKVEGKAEGKAEGKVEGKAESVLTILQERGVPVTRTLRQKILACTDPVVLDRWLRSAISAASAADVLGSH